MTRKQEDRIIAQAQKIIEARKDEMEQRLAVDNEPKVDLRKILYYSAYYQGARNAVLAFKEYITTGVKKDGLVYRKAVIELFTQSLRNAQLYLDGTEVRFRNYEHDKKGKLVKCEAYFVERINIVRELK